MKLDNNTPKVLVFVGRTAEGFNKFLTEKRLNTIDPEVLAGYVLRGIKNFENDDRVSSNILLKEIWSLVGAENAEIALKVTRQFGKLCDFYRAVLDALVEDDNN